MPWTQKELHTVRQRGRVEGLDHAIKSANRNGGDSETHARIGTICDGKVFRRRFPLQLKRLTDH